MATGGRLCDALEEVGAHQINVLLVDDHAAYRRGVRTLLEASPEIRVIGEAGDADEALRALDGCVPDVAVLDLDMPGMDGLALARVIRARQLPVRLILLTVHRNESLIRRALSSGIDGFIAKDCAVAELADGVNAVHQGRSYISGRVS